MQTKPTIAVIGSGNCSQEITILAKEAGKAIAQQGGILLCGGLGGVMAAAAEGASCAGGITVGILPGKHTAAANQFISLPLATGMGHARNIILVQSAAAVLAIGGEYGTLSELAIALKEEKPVAALGSWQVSEKIISFTDPIAAVSSLFSRIAFV